MTQQTDTPDHPLEQESTENTTEPEFVAPPSPALQQFQVNSFIIEDSFYRSRLPKATHWSVVWSDLMMTMFILFLCMFVYQAAHKDFLVSTTPEIIGGSTMDAIDADGFQDLIVPIVPLSRTAPLISSGTVLRVEKVTLDDVNIDEAFREKLRSPTKKKELKTAPETGAEADEQQIDTVTTAITKPATSPAEIAAKDIIEPAPILDNTQIATKEKAIDSFSEMYDISKQSLDANNLEKFAAIEVVPDKTMRIILTGDLLFSVGQAELSPAARQSLMKIAAVIKHTPYMINVIGHTDNIPMNSPTFASNWELSVVRASRVARFLIKATKLNPQQFIVSGYGSHRPRKPNNSAANRAANRRVEIIISKRLPPAVKANPENLL